MYYTEKKEIKQGCNSLFIGRTHDNCKPHARCKMIHKCKSCHEIHAKKQLDKYLSHITDKQLKTYKHALYITITPNSLCDDFEAFNSAIDSYSDYLSNSNKQRYGAHPFNGAEYIIFKEITKSEGNKKMLPHLHIIFLSNQLATFEDNFFTHDIKKIEICLDKKYNNFNDKKNPLTQTLKKIFAYSTKADFDRLNFEKVFDTSKGKKDIKISKLFKFKNQKSLVLFPIHIQQINAIKQRARLARKQALREHEAFKIVHKNSKDITIHKHALKIQRELKKIENTKKELLARANEKLKHAKRRAQRRKSRTHIT